MEADRGRPGGRVQRASAHSSAAGALHQQQQGLLDRGKVEVDGEGEEAGEGGEGEAGEGGGQGVGRGWKVEDHRQGEEAGEGG